MDNSETVISTNGDSSATANNSAGTDSPVMSDNPAGTDNPAHADDGGLINELQSLRESIRQKDQLIREKQSQIDELESLLDKTTSDHLALIDGCTYINSTLDIDRLKRLIMELASSTCSAESSSIMLIDEATDEFYFDSIVGGKAVEPLKPVRFPRDAGIAGWVAKHREPLLIPDVSEDPRFYNMVDRRTDFQTRSMLCVPLISKEKLIGVVEVVNKVAGDFTETDLQNLVALANQAAITIENARLYSDLTEEKKKIETIVNSMADGVVVTDADYNVILMNPAAKDIFMVEKRGGAEEKVRLLLEELRDMGEDSVVDVVLMKPEKIVLSNRTTLMRDAHSRVSGAILAMRNVTEMRRKERLKSEFLTVVAHRLSEPVEDMQECFMKAADAISGEELNKIKTLSSRIMELVVNLVNFSELEAGPMRLGRRAVSLSSLIEKTVSDFTLKSCESGWDINLVSPGDIPDIRIDVERIVQVIETLLANFIELCDESRRIDIEISDEEDTQRVTMSYTGAPLPEELAGDLHDHFKYAESFMFGGLSRHEHCLGLAFIRHIIDAHGGKVFISSAGKRNSFAFSLIKSL